MAQFSGKRDGCGEFVVLAVSVLWQQARLRLLEDDHPVEALAMDELASSSVEQVAAFS